MDESASFWIRFSADANGDGRVSISDAGVLIVEILRLPGDAFVYLLVTYAPPVAEFLELRIDGNSGVVSITASILIWLAAIGVSGTLLHKMREIDRTLTAWIVAHYREARRLTRILKRRIAAWISSRGGEARSDDSLVVEAVSLAGIETAVLRCLSTIDDGAVLTADEIAAKLDRSRRELKPALNRLVELDFVKPDSDSVTDTVGLRIATAGQMYLLGV